MSENAITLVVTLVSFALMAVVFWAKLKDPERPKRHEAGKGAGREVAKVLGCQKAYNIAESLPDGPYKEGYFEGVAEVEDEAK